MTASATLDLLVSPAWHERAKCKGLTETMFSLYPSDHTQAKAICTGCPVKVPCLAHALEHREPHGVWGGLTTSERRLLLKAGPTGYQQALRQIASADRSSRLAAS